MANVALVGAYRDMNVNHRRSYWNGSARCPAGHRIVERQVSSLRVIQMLAEGDESFRSLILVQLAWA